MHACMLFLRNVEVKKYLKTVFSPSQSEKMPILFLNLVCRGRSQLHNLPIIDEKISQLLTRSFLQTIGAGTAKLDGTNKAETKKGCVFIPGVGAFTLLVASCQLFIGIRHVVFAECSSFTRLIRPLICGD